jgi:HSP20 family protein
MAEQIPSRRPRGLLASWRREPLASLREEMEDLFSRFWGEGEEGWLSGSMSPSVDLAETDTGLEVRIDLPGMKPEEIDIQLSNNVLTVRGERKEEKQEKDRTFHRMERRTGSFTRSFTLPCNVDENKIAAAYTDGVLTINLPKAEQAKARKIKIKD